MQVKVSARHGHLSDHHQAEITAKAERLLHFFERITFIEVTVDLAPDHKKHLSAEVLVDAEHKHDFHGRCADEDLLVAVVGAIDKVKQQIKHYKERVQDHRGAPPAAGEAGKRP